MIETTSRRADLTDMLRERQREIQADVHSRIRNGRDRPQDVRDDLELSDTDIQESIELSLLQMRAETLTRVNEALVRLSAGKYGFCFECNREIAERRLRALPFAVRCQTCENRREQERGDARQLIPRCEGLSLFPEFSS